MCVYPAGLAISVFDEEITGADINFVRSKNISVVTFDSDAPESRRMIFEGADNYDIGVKLGEAMNILYPKGGKYRIITGMCPNMELRVKGVQSMLNRIEWSIILPSLNCNENSTLSLELMKILAANSDVQVICLKRE